MENYGFSPPVKTIIILLLLLAFAGFALLLGSAAGLQQACEMDLQLSTRNNIFAVKAFLEQMRSLPATAFASPAVQAQLTSGTLQSLSVLAARSTTGPFTFTPDTECSYYYRYAWLATALQFFAVVFTLCAFAMGRLHSARVAICTFMLFATILATENAHAFLYERDFAPGVTLTRGKVFFVGCLVTCVADMLLVCFLGTHEPTFVRQPTTASSPVYSRENTDAHKASPV